MNILKLIPLLFVAQVTQAGILGNSIFVEPYAGSKTQSTKLTDLANSTVQIKSSQPVFGLKLGYRTVSGIDLNLAGEVSSGNADVTGQPEPVKFSHKLATAQLGVNSFGIIKMYLGFSLANDLILDDATGFQGFTLSGPAYHVGLQLRSVMWLQLGLQYNLNQYNTVTGNGFSSGSSTETYYNKIDSQDYSIYLSTSF